MFSLTKFRDSNSRVSVSEDTSFHQHCDLCLEFGVPRGYSVESQLFLDASSSLEIEISRSRTSCESVKSEYTQHKGSMFGTRQ